MIEGISLTVFLEAAWRTIDNPPDVLERKGADMPLLDSRSTIAHGLLKAWLDGSYRDVEVHIHDTRETLEVGLR